MSMEIDSNNDSITTTTPTKTQTSKNVSGKERSPGKRKKDYVFKFWLALYQRCEPILNEFKSKNSNEKSNKKGDEMKMDTDDDNNTSNANEDKKENREHSNLSSDEDIAMREASIESGNNANGSNVGLTFEKLDAFMGNKQLIALVGKFWAVLQAYIKNESIRKESIKDARIILSTLMISMFPNDVLDVAGMYFSCIFSFFCCLLFSFTFICVCVGKQARRKKKRTKNVCALAKNQFESSAKLHFFFSKNAEDATGLRWLCAWKCFCVFFIFILIVFVYYRHQRYGCIE